MVEDPALGGGPQGDARGAREPAAGSVAAPPPGDARGAREPKAKTHADQIASARAAGLAKASAAKRAAGAATFVLRGIEAAAAGITPLGLPLGHGKRARGEPGIYTREAGGVESSSTPAATSSLHAAKRAAGAAAFALTATLEPGKRARGEAGSGESTGFPGGPSGVELTSELHAGEHAAGTAEHGGCCSGHGGCCSGKGARVADHAAGTASSASGAAVDPSGTPAAISQLHRLWGTAPPFIRDPVVQQPGGATVSLQAARRGCGRRLPQCRGRSALQGVPRPRCRAAHGPEGRRPAGALSAPTAHAQQRTARRAAGVRRARSTPPAQYRGGTATRAARRAAGARSTPPAQPLPRALPEGQQGARSVPPAQCRRRHCSVAARAAIRAAVARRRPKGHQLLKYVKYF